MKDKLKFAATAAICMIAVVNTVLAQEVQLHIDWSRQRWNGYPETVGKITSEWKDHQLHVHTVVDWDSSFQISEKNPRSILHGDKLLLCYEKESLGSDIKKPSAPAVVAPVILEFTIKGIPEHNYLVDVSNQCPLL
ncbi:hypothetical protein HDE76_001292 [Rhodanobacter sp. ANJX3]|uniref:hypothetical protein n=1 Tax=Rhodanobacter sp. ANJX3 TaxID=2723083 RepID=UPI00161809F0|nr:hypothetical protein [Rhodanobacter sp. ANJX3]MBB5358086.1 hypothetical protein [Rhodanobacter sp. ANJX3]